MLSKKLLAPALASALLLSGCTAATPDFTLTVTVTGWNGWATDPTDVPEPEVFSFDVSADETYEVKGLIEPVHFTVEEINEHSIRIKLDESLAKADGHRISMDDTRTSWTVQESKVLELATPTYDVGYHFEFDLDAR